MRGHWLHLLAPILIPVMLAGYPSVAIPSASELHSEISAAATTESQAIQPDPVVVVSNGSCPGTGATTVIVRLTFTRQQSGHDLASFVAAHDLRVQALGWEWDDHHTHFPVNPSAGLEESLRALHAFEVAHLSSLVDELESVAETYRRLGNPAAAADAREQISAYTQQLQAVRQGPIRVAYVDVESSTARSREFIKLPGVTVTDCRLAHRRGTSGMTAERPEVGVQDHYDQWQPSQGILLLRDDGTSGTPYISNYMTWRTLSGFTLPNVAYEHDIKISPWDFTECRVTMPIPAEPWVDCEGPYTHNLPSLSSPYMDTRFSDSLELNEKDFTVGIGNARALRVNRSYYVRVYLTNIDFPAATVYMQPQLQGGAQSRSERTFCSTFREVLGPAACYFVRESDPRDRWSYQVFQDSYNYFTWSR